MSADPRYERAGLGGPSRGEGALTAGAMAPGQAWGPAIIPLGTRSQRASVSLARPSVSLARPSVPLARPSVPLARASDPIAYQAGLPGVRAGQ